MKDYEIITLNQNNIDNYDIFCLKSRYKSPSYQEKLQWVKNGFKDGLVLKILYVNEGKKELTSRGMIEYIPGENNWRGITADGYMVIHCLWVVGKHKGKGYASKLVQDCLNDAEEMNGVAVVTSKRHWIVKNKLFIKMGFTKVDDYPPHFELFTKCNFDTKNIPKFNKNHKSSLKTVSEGLGVYRSPQCPYTYNMENHVKNYAENNEIPIEMVSIENKDQAQRGYHPYGTFYITYHTKTVTYESIPKIFQSNLEEIKKK
ncbi:MAG: GNAT family N-acetyltransferase [Candidatus Hodarchaeales archaeon]